MQIPYIALGVLSLPATHILSNLLWQQFRETRGIAILLSSPEALRQVLTPNVLSSPRAEVAQFARPFPGGYHVTMRAFRESDRVAHGRGRALLRVGLAVVVVGSGVVGFLGIGWLGLGFPIVNTFIGQATFLGSTRGAINSEATDRAVQHVRIVAVILHRWIATNPHEVADWLQAEPRMKLLAEHVANLQT